MKEHILEPHEFNHCLGCEASYCRQCGECPTPGCTFVGDGARYHKEEEWKEVKE